MSNSLKDIFPPKVKLTKLENTIKLDVTGNESLLEPEYSVPLELMGFEESVDGIGYFITTNDPDNMIKRTVKQLTTWGFEIYPNSELDETIKKFKNIEEYLNTSKDRGQRIKNQKTPVGIFPKNFDPSIKIFPYQLKPIQHMIEVGNAANFSVPGSGKTLMTYAVFDKLRSDGIVDSLLVVGPLASFGPWEEQYKFCFNKKNTDKIFRYLGPSRFNELKNLKNYDIILTSYPTAVNDIEHLKKELLSEQKIMMVIDESHHIKRFRADASIATGMIELGKYAERRYILSGTPVPRDFEDLWSQITFLWPHNQILGTREGYKSILESFNPGSEISEKISFLWTRVTNDHLKKDMPKTIPKTIPVPMSEKQENIYKGIENEIYDLENKEYFDQEEHSTFRKNRVLRLLQSATNPAVMLYDDDEVDIDAFYTKDPSLTELVHRYDEISPKIKIAAEEALKISKKDENVIVWTVFIKNVDAICKTIKELDPNSNPIGISGEIDIDSNVEKDFIGREERLDEFRDNKGAILVATMGSIAESVSLHKSCRNAIYLERNFNAGQYMQSLSRIFRIGSDKNKPVNYIFLRTVFRDKFTDTIDGTIDSKLKERIKRLYTLLNDEFEIHPLSLESPRYNMKNMKGHGSKIDDETEITYKKVNEMISRHKKNKKI